MTEQEMRRYAKLKAIEARYEALKTERDGMNADGDHAYEAYAEIAHRMEDIADEFEAMA